MIFSVGSGVNDSVFGKSQEPIRMMMEKDIEGFEQNSVVGTVFKKVNSKSFAEKFTSMTALGNFEDVGEGGAYPVSEKQEGYDKVISAREWKQSFVITQTMVEDNKILDLQGGALGFTQAYGRGKEEFCCGLLAGATSTQANIFGRNYDATSADNVPLFYASHPSVTGECDVQSNIFSDSCSSISAAKAAIGKVAVKMSNFKDDNGHLLSVNPDTIIIPNDYTVIDAVFGAIGAEKDPALAGGNGFNYNFGKWNVIVSGYLNSMVTSANTAPFILFDSKYNERVGGAIFLDRVPLTVKSYIDENTDNNVWKGRTRYSAGFNNWRAFALGGISTASAA